MYSHGYRLYYLIVEMLLRSPGVVLKTMTYFLILLGLVVCTHAQSVNLSGHVTGDGSRPLSGASVSLQSSGLTVTTNAEGAWSLDSGTVSLQGGLDRKGSPRLDGDAVLFSSHRKQVISWSILDHSGRTVAHSQGREYGLGDQRIQLPRLSAGSGIYFFNCNINGQASSVRFLNIQQVRFGDLALAVSRPPLFKSAAAADTLIFSKAGYTTGKLPVSGSSANYNLRLFKAGGEERFGILTMVGGIKKISSCRLDGTDAKMIPTPDVNIEEAAWSPDGRRIAFTTREGIDKDFNWQIYVMNADGSQLQAVARGYAPSWHENGDWLAWVHFTRINEQVGQLNYKIIGEVRAAEFKDSIATFISFQGGTGAIVVAPKAHAHFDRPKWLPGNTPAVVAYHTYSEFTTPTTGFSRYRIYKITKTEPYSSYTILATNKQDYWLHFLGVLFDGTVLFRRWDGLVAANRENVFSNHTWDNANGEQAVGAEIMAGAYSPNSHRVVRENAFMDVFGGGNRVAPAGMPQGIFSWYIAY